MFFSHSWDERVRVDSRSPELLFCSPRAILTCVTPTHAQLVLVIRDIVICNYIIRVRLVQPPCQQCARNT